MEIRPKDTTPDPLLTGWSVQFGTGGGMVQDEIAPLFGSGAQIFKFPTYTADSLDASDVKTEVAPGDTPNKIKRRLPTFTPIEIPRHALDDELPNQAIVGGRGPLVRQRNRVETLTHRLRIGLEKRVKALLDANGTGTAVNASKNWDDASPDIEKQLDDEIEAFETGSNGYLPTHIIMSRKIANVAKRDPAIRALRKATDEKLLVDGSLPPSIWGMKVVIPGALVNTAAPGLAQTVDRIWNANTVYLVYVNPQFATDGESMTAIARASWNEFGLPFAAFAWEDSHKSKRTHWVGVDHNVKEHVVCSVAIRRLTGVLN